ncbi:MAG TPA: thioredoxin domain-containing protein [Thermoanaerobaculia bacterium]
MVAGLALALAPTSAAGAAAEPTEEPALTIRLPGAEPYPAELQARLRAAVDARGEGYEPRTHHLRDDGSAVYVNRLIFEDSPYLIQHAHNPVDWYPWGPEAFARAAREDKPIFLSIGYSTCHWCHVMERESFEDAEIARVLNEKFVAVKVDREQRPDIDEIYMTAVQLTTGRGGWPMSSFLTPDGKPFYGGSYFPNARRYGIPSFRDVLEGVAEAWAERRAETVGSAERIAAAIAAGQGAGAAPAHPQAQSSDRDLLQPAILDAAEARLADTFDWANGSWGGAPKFPQPMALEFLLRRAVGIDDRDARGSGEDPRGTRLLRMVAKTLDAMADGGIRDQLGGGFHRYSTDEVWLVPHFEKMLYDNAQLVRVYLHTWQLTGEQRYREVAESTIDYVARDMTLREGGFAASEDADSEGEEGRFYAWSLAEIEEVLGDEAALFATAYDVRTIGNWEGRTILRRVRSDAQLEALFGSGAGRESTDGDSDSDGVSARLARARRALFEARDRRVRPARDDKALASWNGLMLAAVAEAARVLERADYRDLAERNATFLLERLRTREGRLRRSWKDGRATLNGYLEDYASVAEGLLALYETTFDPRWFGAARELMDEALLHFADPGGGFFDTSDDHEELVARPKGVQDNAVPSGNAMATTVLLKLAAWTGEGRYRDAAEAALRPVGPYLGRHPTGFAQWLTALDFALAPVREIAIAGDPGAADTQRLLASARVGYRPHQVVAVGVPAAAETIPLLAERPLIGDHATAYVCRGFVCELPVSDPGELAAQLTRQPSRPT